MVGPSLTEERRQVASRRLKLGFVALVALSGGFVALAAGAPPVGAAAGVGGGVLVGVALLYYLSRIGREWRRPR